MRNEKEIDVTKKMNKADLTAKEALNRKEPLICEPEYLGENTVIGCRSGRCKCGNIVRSYHKFCSECGIKLEWENVHG